MSTTTSYIMIITVNLSNTSHNNSQICLSQAVAWRTSTWRVVDHPLSLSRHPAPQVKQHPCWWEKLNEGGFFFSPNDIPDLQINLIIRHTDRPAEWESLSSNSAFALVASSLGIRACSVKRNFAETLLVYKCYCINIYQELCRLTTAAMHFCPNHNHLWSYSLYIYYTI